jgi:alpha-ketoglutarate-dependent taurine dioxygenase
MNDLTVFSILSAIALCTWATGSPLQAESRNPEQDRATLIVLENEWLANEHNAPVLERILASAFVHPVPIGDFATKAQHIAFSSAHPAPANQKQHFDQMRVRVYGDIGIVNGVVITTDEKGHEADRTVFTDVFVWRDGRWQAVNAQENGVKTH